MEGSSNVLIENEYEANIFVAKLMRFTAVAFILIYIMNLTGVFIVDNFVMTMAFLLGMIILMIPTIIVNGMKIREPYVKYVCVICAAIFIGILALTLTFHSVIMYVYAMAIGSIYFNKAVSNFAGGISIAILSLAQIGGYLLVTVIDDNFPSMHNLIIYGIFPRAIEMVALWVIFSNLSGRTSKMLGNIVGIEEQNRLFENMQTMGKKSNEVSSSLKNSVGTLSLFTDNTSKVNNQVALATGTMSSQSESLTLNITEATEGLENVSDNIQKIALQSEFIAELSGSVNNLTTDNSQMMEQAITEMNDINQSNAFSNNVIHTLEEKSEQINNIIEVITNISNQTNLLALNASIEASRAGEQGRGFSVVAEQIRILAEQTRNAVGDIQIIVNEVMENTDSAARSMEKSLALAENGVKIISKAAESSEQVLKASKDMNGKIKEMSGATKSVAYTSSHVVQLISEIKDISYKNLEEIQKVAEVSNNGIDEVKKIVELVESISGMAKELEELSCA